LVDLNNLAKSNGNYGNMKSPDGWDYFVNFCAPVNHACNGDSSYMAIQTYQDNDCNSIAAKAADASSSNVAISDTAGAEGSPPEVTLRYSGGEGGRTASFRCICAEKQSEPEVAYSSGAGTTAYSFTVTAKACCPGSLGGHGGRSIPLGPVYGIGGLLITLAVVAIILFFVIGIIVQAVRGVRGPQMIPFFNFWKQVPILFWLGISWLPQVIIAKVKNKKSLYEQA